MTIGEFLDKVENFEKKTQREQVKLISYFYCVANGKQEFSSAQIRACFVAESLRLPSNISHDLIQLSECKPPVLVKRQSGGFSFERSAKKMLGEQFNGESKEVLSNTVEEGKVAGRKTQASTSVKVDIFHVGVITASPDEFNAIKNLLSNWEQLPNYPNDSVSYYKGVLERNGKKFSIILPHPLDMGMSPAAILTTKVISNFGPKYLFMIGIAAGNKKVNNIGDILIAEKSLNYHEVVELERKDKSPSQKFMQTPDSINKHLKTELTQFSNSDHIREIHSLYPYHNKISKPLKCSLGLVVTGSSLLRSQTKVEEINEMYPNVVGLDMETHGFYYAAAHNLRQLPPYFVSIKSVSDFGDNTDHKLTPSERRKYALHTASTAFEKFVSHYIVPE